MNCELCADYSLRALSQLRFIGVRGRAVLGLTDDRYVISLKNHRRHAAAAAAATDTNDQFAFSHRGRASTWSNVIDGRWSGGPKLSLIH